MPFPTEAIVLLSVEADSYGHPPFSFITSYFIGISPFLHCLDSLGGRLLVESTTKSLEMIMYTFTPIYIEDNYSSKNAKVIID